MKLHHVGVVVQDLAQQGEAYRGLLGMVPLTDVILDPLQQVNARFWGDSNGSVVELLAPTGPESPIWRESQKGGGLHHLCYETPHLDKSLEELTAKGAKITRPPAPGIAFDGRRIAFLFSLELGLIEFLETRD